MSSEIYTIQAMCQCYRTFTLWVTPILEWDPREKTFYTLAGGWKNCKYWPWIFICFGIVVGTGATTCMFTVLKASHFDIVNVMFSLILFFTCLSIFGCVGVMVWHAEDIVLAFNRMKTLLNQMEYFYQQHQRKRNLVSNDNFRKIHGFLKQVIMTTLLIALFFPPGAIIGNIDPYINVYTYYLKPHLCPSTSADLPPPSCKTPDQIAFIIRLILGYFDVTEACRCFSTLMITLFLWLELQTKYFDHLGCLENHHFFPWYSRYQICLRTWEKALFEWIRILMSLFFAVIVSCNVITFRFVLLGRMPAYAAWFIPTVSAMYMATVYLLFPYIMGCHEDTIELLRKRKFELFSNCFKSSLEFRLQQRQLKSTKPISFRCGGSFILRKETKSSFYGEVVARTVDAILMK